MQLIYGSILNAPISRDSLLFSNNEEFLDKWAITSRAMPDTFDFIVLDDRLPHEYDMLPR